LLSLVLERCITAENICNCLLSRRWRDRTTPLPPVAGLRAMQLVVSTETANDIEFLLAVVFIFMSLIFT